MIAIKNIRKFAYSLDEVKAKYPHAHIEYCGREGNGLPSGRLGNYAGQREPTRGEQIAAFRKQLWADIQAKKGMYEALLDLVATYQTGRDIILVCWCAPLPCHTEVIKRAIEWMAAQNDVIVSEREMA